MTDRARPARAVIFDMDGVLVDSEPVHYQAMSQVLARHGRQLTWPAFLDYIGQTAHATWEALVQRLRLPATPATYSAEYRAEMEHVLQAAALTPMPGLLDLLDRLAAAGIAVAVASSSPRRWIDLTLTALGLGRHFAVVVSGDDVVHGKPDPAIYRQTAAALGYPPAQCIAVEDAPAGLASARAAGMRVVALQTPYVAAAALAAADRYIRRLEEFPLAWCAAGE